MRVQGCMSLIHCACREVRMFLRTEAAGLSPIVRSRSLVVKVKRKIRTGYCVCVMSQEKWWKCGQTTRNNRTTEAVKFYQV